MLSKEKWSSGSEILIDMLKLFSWHEFIFGDTVSIITGTINSKSCVVYSLNWFFKLSEAFNFIFEKSLLKLL